MPLVDDMHRPSSQQYPCTGVAELWKEDHVTATCRTSIIRF